MPYRRRVVLDPLLIYPARLSNAFSIFFGLGRGFWSFLSDLCYAYAALPLFTESELVSERGEEGEGAAGKSIFHSLGSARSPDVCASAG